MSPDRDVRRQVAEAPSPKALEPGLRTRAYVFNTLLARQGRRRPAALLHELARRAQPLQRGHRRVGAGADRGGPGALRPARSAGTGSRRRCSASSGSPTTTAWPRSPRRRSSIAWPAGPRARARLLQLVLARPRATGRPLLRRSAGSTRRCGPASAAARSARTRVPSAAPLRAAQLHRPAPRRADARPRAGPRRARRARRAAGRLPPGHAADAGGDGVGVRRDDRVRAPARRGRRAPSRGSALLAESIEGSIATVFRQIAMNRFEDLVHTEPPRRRASCRSSASASCGPRARRSCSATPSRSPTGYRSWWSYVPHFINTPGLRLRLRLRAAARAVGLPPLPRGGRRRSSPSYLELLVRRRVDAARGARRGSSASTSPIPASGTPGSISWRSSSTPPRRLRGRRGGSDGRRLARRRR